MYHRILTPLALLLLAAGALAQTTAEQVYYRFILPTGTSIRNFAPAGPATGTLRSTYPTTGSYTRAPGCTAPYALYGSHLDPATKQVNSAYHNYVDTGWTPSFSGSFTVAWFEKERCPNTTNGLAYLISGVGSFRIFHGGVANNGLYLRDWGGSPSDLVLVDPAQTGTGPKFDLLDLARQRWVHVAIVVDAKVMKATWYIDGRPLSPAITLTAGASVTGTSSLKVGQHLSTGSSFRHDLDEFRFYTRAATPAEVLAWASVRPGESWSYIDGCKGSLSAVSGPSLGQPYMMDVGGAAGAVGIVSVGFSRTRLGTLPLPFDLGLAVPSLKGCLFASSLHIILPASLDATGKGKAVIPVPNDPIYSNLPIYCQGVLATPAMQFASTNGLGGIIGL